MMQMLKMWAKNGADATVLNADALRSHIDQVITSINLSYSLPLERTGKKEKQNKLEQRKRRHKTVVGVYVLKLVVVCCCCYGGYFADT